MGMANSLLKANLDRLFQLTQIRLKLEATHELLIIDYFYRFSGQNRRFENLR